MNYVLDKSKAKTIELSNDAFFYIYKDEEPLDDDNIVEAKNILAQFPNGFVILDWAYAEASRVSATFAPYVDNYVEYDGQMPFICKDWVLRYKYLSKEVARITIVNLVTNKINIDCDCKVVYIKNKPWVMFTKNGDASHFGDNQPCCRIPLWKT